MRDFRESKLVAEKNQKWSGRPLHNINKKAISHSQHSSQHRSVHVRCVRAGSLILVSPYSSCGVVCPAGCIQSHMPFRLCSLAQLPVLPPTQWCAMVDAVLHSLSHASQLACGASRELSLSNLCSVWSLSLSLSSLSVCISPCDTPLCAPGHVAHEHKSKLMTEEAVPWSTCIAVQLSILLSVEQEHNCSFSQSTQQVAIEARDQTARLAVTNEH